MSYVQIVTPKRAVLRFSLSDDAVLRKEVVSKDCPFRFNSPSWAEVLLAMKMFNAKFTLCNCCSCIGLSYSSLYCYLYSPCRSAVCISAVVSVSGKWNG